MSACCVCNISCDNAKSDSVVKCVGGCGKLAHYTCIKADLEGKKTRSSREWKCRECRNASSSKSSVSSVSSELTKDFLLRVMDQFKNEVFGELRSFKMEMSELSASVQFMSDKLEASNKLMESIKAELKTLKEENKELRDRSDNLTTEVRDLRERLRNLEQYTRKNNVEISGVPETGKENVLDIVRDVGSALGVEIQESQVAAAHRIPSYRKDRSPSLIVQFHNRQSKDTLLSKFREKKMLTASEVNSAFPPKRVYVNEHLSPENKLFLARLKQKCRDAGYAYVWCRDGKFFVRKQQGEKSHRIITYDDFVSIK